MEVKIMNGDYPPPPQGPPGPPGPPEQPRPSGPPRDERMPPPNYYPPPYRGNFWRQYPALSLVTFLIRMVGVLVIFIGVILIGTWISDLYNADSNWSNPDDMFEDLGTNVVIIGIGGIIMSVSYLIDGIARFAKGKFETSRK